ncbi:MAG: glycoside hydrolase family 44 protein [Myxococcaceae bacterium]
MFSAKWAALALALVACDPNGGRVLKSGDAGVVELRFDIRSDKDVRAISPLIYGINGTEGLDAVRPTVVRAGGNRWTAFNWESNASNAGSDYCFQNDGYLGDSNTPGETVRGFVSTAQAAGAAAIITVPIVEHVAGDKTGGSAPPECSGDVRKSGDGYLASRFRKNQASKGSAFSFPPNPDDGVVSQDELVAWLKSTSSGANILYGLDNEPDLWSFTHPQIHPAKVGYNELVELNIRYAKAIKAVVPDAKVLGFSSYGWLGYVSLQEAPDAAGKGEFIDFYLRKMKEAEATHGKRLIDVLDLHWYPEARGGGVRVIGTEVGDAVVAARIQAPRSLWDDTYVEDSWVAESIQAPIRLIPRIREKIAKNYSATGLAFTEWNYGGGGDISGALASADVLGIFGRESVTVATFWPLNPDERYALAALQAFRNFDGKGARFGDTSIRAVSSDNAMGSVYASVESTDRAQVTVVAINKLDRPTTVGITVAHPRRFEDAQVFVLTSTAPALQAAGALPSVDTNAFRYAMPARSVTVIRFR